MPDSCATIICYNFYNAQEQYKPKINIISMKGTKAVHIVIYCTTDLKHKQFIAVKKYNDIFTTVYGQWAPLE